jgi:HlyD family secretion protein
MKNRTSIALIIVALIALAAFLIVPRLSKKDSRLIVSGRVEADEINLSSRIPGRLSSVNIKDGSSVNKGDIVAALEDAELQSRHNQAKAGIAELGEKIRASESSLAFTKNNTAHTIEEAEKVVASARSKLRQAESKRENAAKELQRFSALKAKDAVSEQRFDSVRLTSRLAEDEVTTAAKDVERAGVTLLKAGDSRELVKARELELSALRKSLDQLREALRQVEIQLGYAGITAPANGIVLRKTAEPGEVIPAGGVVGVMIIPEDVHVRTYVPEKYIGRIRPGMSADVLSDAYPAYPIKGNVCHISDRAEFTPKEVQSYEERVKQVFSVKICFSKDTTKTPDSSPFFAVLKKGMPVDVRFNLDVNRK